MVEDSGAPFKITPRQRKQDDAFSVMGQTPVPDVAPKQPEVKLAPERPVKTPKPPRVKGPKRSRRQRFSRTAILITILTVCSLAIGLVGGYLLGNYNTVSRTSIKASVTLDRALTEPGLQSLPPGFTGQQILDQPSISTVGGQNDQAIAELVGTIGKQFGITFKQVSKPSSLPLTSASVKHTLLYQVNSSTFTATGKTFSDSERRQMVNTVNGIVKKYGYEPFNVDALTTGAFANEKERIRVFGSADPISAQLFIITNHSTKRLTDTYSVSITGAPTNVGANSTAQLPTVSIAFSSYPYLKPGTDSQFKAQVLKDYEAVLAKSKIPATNPASQ